MKSKGYALPEVVISMAIGSIIALVSLTYSYRLVYGIYQSKSLTYYVNDVFDAMDLRFYEELSSNGRCFSSNPPTQTIASLVASRHLSAKHLLNNWFDPYSLVLTYRVNPVTGWANGYSIKFPLPNPELNAGFRNSPYYYGETSTELEFRKGLEFDLDDEFVLHMDSSFCEK